MRNNLILGPDAHIRHVLDILRAEIRSGPVRPNVHLSPDIWFSFAEGSDASGQWQTGQSRSLSIRIHGDRIGPWFGLHAAMGPADCRHSAIIGLVCRVKASQLMTIRPVIRSGIGGGFVDTPFSKKLICYAKESSHIDVLDLETRPDFPRTADWRDLILFFEPKEMDVDIVDLRLFVI